MIAIAGLDEDNSNLTILSNTIDGTLADETDEDNSNLTILSNTSTAHFLTSLMKIIQI